MCQRTILGRSAMRYKNQNSQQSYTPHYERHSTIAGDMRSTDIYQLTMAEPNPKRRKIGPELRELYLKVEQELEEKNFNKVKIGRAHV